MKLHYDLSVSAIESMIRAKGARLTPARVRVLALLRSSHRQLSHSEIEQLLNKEGMPNIDRVTLYRVLDWLVDVTLAHKAPDARGVFCFAAANPDMEHTKHMHFRCTDCGNVFCLDAPPPPPPELPGGFHLISMEFDVCGLCKDCYHPPLLLGIPDSKVLPERPI